jgi:hypothetical protein
MARVLRDKSFAARGCSWLLMAARGCSQLFAGSRRPDRSAGKCIANASLRVARSCTWSGFPARGWSRRSAGGYCMCALVYIIKQPRRRHTTQAREARDIEARWCFDILTLCCGIALRHCRAGSSILDFRGHAEVHAMISMVREAESRRYS